MNQAKSLSQQAGWDSYYIRLLNAIAEKSQDEHSKYAAIIVDGHQLIRSTGYNGLPRGVHYHNKYHARPDKWIYFVHAEQNAIFNAARIGTSVEGCTIYVLRPPCVECVKAIIQSGILIIRYVEEHKFDPKVVLSVDDWRSKMEAAQELLYSAGIAIKRIGDD